MLIANSSNALCLWSSITMLAIRITGKAAIAANAASNFCFMLKSALLNSIGVGFDYQLGQDFVLIF
ncbi:hypothetical protein D9M68_598120 [compost metagenome]